MAEHITQIVDLKPFEKVSVEGKVVELNNPKEITDKKSGEKHRVQEAILQDQSGRVTLNLWDRDCDTVALGDYIRVINGWTSLYKDSLRVSRGKFGTIEKAEIA